MADVTRRTVVVEGPLAFQMRKAAAARAGENGLQLLTLPHLVARLAGGFIRPACSQELDAAIRKALDPTGLRELGNMCALPGMTRALSRSLLKIWQADQSLAALAGRSARFADLFEIEQRIRAYLPSGVLTLPDLRSAAMARIAHARATLGSVELDLRRAPAPLWHRLLERLAMETPLSWRNPDGAELPPAWFAGKLIRDDLKPAMRPERVSCANPRAEVVEALRWARELLASGRAAPHEIAIVAPNTEVWDPYFEALVNESGLPVHFTHGVSALGSYDGQTCAALADVLLQGLSQKRIRRLFSYIGGGPGLRDLLRGWGRGLRRDAALFTLDQWRTALADAMTRGEAGVDVRPVVLPVLELLARGAAVAEEAGAALLTRSARLLWTEALRRAPAGALELALKDLRLPDKKDPATAVVWCPAHHLVEAPRSYVRLIGLTSRGWPRRGTEDPLIPSHLLSGGLLDPNWVTVQDREAFRIVVSRASGTCVLSRGRRDQQGKLLPASPLATAVLKDEIVLKRTRTPPHAFSQSDRLLARPADAAADERIASATLCANNRRAKEVTPHDGLIRVDHPLVERALNQVQSATSLRLMLRDPLGYLWRYALGWHAPAEDDEPLELSERSKGMLVHEILRRAVESLEPVPGYTRAAEPELRAAVASARAAIRDAWPLEVPVPPPMLWDYTLEKAERLAYQALTLDTTLPDSRSWAEVDFGKAEAIYDVTTHPWPPNTPVIISGTPISLCGTIDRLDRRSDDKVRVSDYKTGKVPEQPAYVLNGGRELQRVVYALAVRAMLPETPRIVARLVYLEGEGPREFKLPNVEAAIAEAVRHVTAARTIILRGVTLPGPDADERWNEFRLALPAGTYLDAKRASFARAFGPFTRVWDCP